MLWFTSDTHFGHARIIELCNRPFGNVAQMDASLIANWNEKVGPEDIVYHLGDFTLSGDLCQVEHWLNRLNGDEINILALSQHHDGRWLKELDRRSLSRELLSWQTRSRGAVNLLPPEWLITEPDASGAEIMLAMSHYPMREWDRKHHGSIHLHGHSHGRSDLWPATLDVGVDTELADYAPVSLETILAALT